jgi:hypothetical protein
LLDTACDLMSCCDCGSCDWPRRRQDRHAPVSPARRRPPPASVPAGRAAPPADPGPAS